MQFNFPPYLSTSRLIFRLPAKLPSLKPTLNANRPSHSHNRKSIPYQTMSSTPIDFEVDDRFDGLYMNVANQAHGIEPLLDSVFSFLRRRSDFFAGPPGLSSSSGSGGGKAVGNNDAGTDAAISTVHKVLQKHVDIYLNDKRKKEEEVAAKKRKKEMEMKLKQQQQHEKEQQQLEQATMSVKSEEDVIELDVIGGGFDISQPSSPAVISKVTTTVKDTDTKSDNEAKSVNDETKAAANAASTTGDEDDDEGGKDSSTGPPPIGNGSTIPGKYTWTQTLQELCITAPLPPNTRGKDLTVIISKNHLKIGLKTGNKQIIDTLSLESIDEKFR